MWPLTVWFAHSANKLHHGLAKMREIQLLATMWRISNIFKSLWISEMSGFYPYCKHGDYKNGNDFTVKVQVYLWWLLHFEHIHLHQLTMAYCRQAGSCHRQSIGNLFLYIPVWLIRKTAWRHFNNNNAPSMIVRWSFTKQKTIKTVNNSSVIIVTSHL